MKTLVLLVLTSGSIMVSAQQQYYDVLSGNGNGVRFWNGDDFYKIHMGSGTEYQFGPVTDYSIKMNMSNTVGRGWTWGVVGLAPIAAINTLGHMQIAGKFTVAGNSNPINFTSSWTSSPDNSTNVSEISNDVSNYQQLMIVGNKAQGADRRVGIWDRLSINGAGFSQTFNVNGGGYFVGNVGIGTSAPVFRLDVEGTGARIKNQHTSSNAYTTFRLQGADYAEGLEIDFFGNNNITSDPNWSYGGGPGSAAIINVNAKPLVLGTNNQGRLLIDGNGNVSIGTTDSKGYKLAIVGKAIAEEVVVKVHGNWPDYVFDGDYELLPLVKLEEYIQTKKHLPDVPTAEDVKENGLSLGEMNAILLKKVEELTLYVIELKKESSDAKEAMTAMKQQIESLKH